MEERLDMFRSFPISVVTGTGHEFRKHSQRYKNSPTSNLKENWWRAFIVDRLQDKLLCK